MTDHACLISVCKDRGHTFAAHSEHDLGAEGDFTVTVTRTRLGQARDFRLKVAVTSRYRADLISGCYVARSE